MWCDVIITSFSLPDVPDNNLSFDRLSRNTHTHAPVHTVNEFMCSNMYTHLIQEEKENTLQVKAWTNLMNTTMSGCQNTSGFPSTTDLKISTFCVSQ